MGKPQKKKSPSKLETARTILEMLSNLAVIVGTLYQMLKD